MVEERRSPVPPSPAEVARTLAAGRLLGAAHAQGHRGGLRVRHATTAEGTPLLLTRATGDLAAALFPEPGETDRAVALSVDDVPPVCGAPSHGRLWLSGWARLLGGAEARAAADEYAAGNPTGDLLTVGRGHALYRMEVGEVRLARGDTLVEVDVDDYRQAQPDPLHADERVLLADLNDHHRQQLAQLVAVVTGAPAPADCRAVRIDRYGLLLVPSTVDQPARRVRIAFPRPARDLPDVATLVRPMLCTSCRTRSRHAGTHRSA
jgi:heme iron utilization protein